MTSLFARKRWIDARLLLCNTLLGLTLACTSRPVEKSSHDDVDDASEDPANGNDEHSNSNEENSGKTSHASDDTSEPQESTSQESGDDGHDSTSSTDASGEATQESSDSTESTTFTPTGTEESRCILNPFEHIDASRIYADIEYLASPALEGRLPGTMGDELSRAHAIAAFEFAGLEPIGDKGTYLQHFSTDTPVQVEPAQSAIADVPLVDGLDFQVHPHGKGGAVHGELVDLGYGLRYAGYVRKTYPTCPLPAQGRDDLRDAGTVRGKIAIIDDAIPNDEEISNRCPKSFALDTVSRAKVAHEAGALMVIIVREELPSEAKSCHHTPSPIEKLSFPLVFVRRAALARQLPTLFGLNRAKPSFENRATGNLGSEFDLRVEIVQKRVSTANLLGVLRGTDPEIGHEVIVVGGHIDHLGKKNDDIYFGADDNASGAAIVLELARQFELCRINPKRTILFAEFNAEEMGLIGSNYYVSHPVFALKDTKAMYNFDMVGAGDSSGVLVFGGDDDNNRWMTDLLQRSALEDGLDYVIQTTPQKLATDHAAFVRAGVPAIFNFARPDPHPGYHTPEDDIGNIKIETLKMVAELYWSSLRRVAMGLE